jgi:hypothetical protein
MGNCEHCNQNGAVATPTYIGGHGYVDVMLCEDRAECWQRYDAECREGLNNA